MKFLTPLLMCCCLLPLIQAEVRNLPNIIIIQTDDQGLDDFSHRHEIAPLETPNLDALAEESLQFTQFYVHPSCAPTRASLLTGKHHLRAGVWGVHGGTDYVGLNQTLLSDYLKRSDYETAHIGKWHTGKSDGYWPWDRGFDTAYYAELYVYKDNVLLTKDGRISTEGWTEEVLADLAIEFISRDRESPFFLYYCPITPHTGIHSRKHPGETGVHAPDEFMAEQISRGHSKQLSGVYAGIEFLDNQIGRLLKALNENGETQNTLVIFLSDNGPLKDGSLNLSDSEWQLRNPSNLRGQKSEVWENGIRSPLFMRWPENDSFRPRRITEVASVSDLLPTLLDIINLETDTKEELDGKSLLPLIDDIGSTTTSEIMRISSKTWLSMNLNLELNTHFEPNRNDFYLSYDNPKNRVQTERSIRSENLKLVGESLFDLSRCSSGSSELSPMNPIEWTHASESLDQSFGDWWTQRVLTSPHAFIKPVYYIGRNSDQSTLVYPHGAVTFTPKHTRPHSHAVKGFVNPGDKIGVKIHFERPGEWEIYVAGKINRSTDAQFSLKARKTRSSSLDISKFSINPTTRMRLSHESLPPDSSLWKWQLETYSAGTVIVSEKHVGKDLLLEFQMESREDSANSPVWQALSEIIFVPTN